MTGKAPAGRPVRRRLDAATRRETILTAAIQAFAGAGYDQVRVADIAAKIGVTEPVVFQNFGTKADLFAAVLDRTADDFARHLTAQADHEDDVLALLARMLTPERLDRLHNRGNLGALFIDSAARADERIQQRARQAITRLAEAVARLLARGQAAGSIRADTEPITLAWYVLSLLQARQFRRTHTATPSPALEHALLTAALDTLHAPNGDSNVAHSARGGTGRDDGDGRSSASSNH
jgi:AcrR family transcriptional regulator